MAAKIFYLKKEKGKWIIDNHLDGDNGIYYAFNCDLFTALKIVSGEFRRCHFILELEERT
jgi:hypothetical protein